MMEDKYDPGTAKTQVLHTEATVAEKTSPPGMSMDSLKAHYRDIMRARAIYYPVAYHFQKVLGRGRQGTVFLGLRQGARGCITEHAIKVFDPELYRNPEEYWTDMGRIASQISRLQRVQSPYLVPRHSYEETYGIGYVQMEAIDGIDLRYFITQPHMRLVKQRSSRSEWRRFTETIFRIEKSKVYLQTEVALYILRGVLRGLERLHESNFLHYDVKPGNIMIDRLGSVKVVDFGRAVIAGEQLTFLLGSPMYMAPETHSRKPGTFQSDIYSLGLIMLEMLRGEPLVSGVPEEKKLLEIKMDIIKALPDLLPLHLKKNRTLIMVLKRMIHPNPARRYMNAREAEIGEKGLKVLDKRFARAGITTEFARELSEYISKLVDVRTDRIELDQEEESDSSVLKSL